VLLILLLIRRNLLQPVLFASASFSLALGTSAAPAPSIPTNLQWLDARDLAIEGKGWSKTKHFYDRLPPNAETAVRPAVWNLSHDSAGMAVHFTSDAASFFARWTLRKEQLAMPHMPATGVSGLDLYVRSKGKWHWLGTGRPDKYPTVEKQLVANLQPTQREYLLYLPLYNGIEELKIGIPQGAKIQSVSPSPPVKPVVFYGTSILQGGCASRPGMAYPAILSRRLDFPHINLGFSGNAWSEPELAHLLAELDPRVYVLDPLPNMTAERVKERIEPFVKILRESHPLTPIILVENILYPDGDFVAVRRDKYTAANAELQSAYDRLRKSGVGNLFYVPATNLIGDDTEATVDGTHPTDLGFQRMADALEPFLRRALKTR
jgi:lysophospholipase L1-like esterase